MVESRGWNHPRPSADPRLLFFAIGLAYVNLVQAFLSTPKDSVSFKAYDTEARYVLCGLVTAGAILLIRAAFCDSQYSSWGWEAASCMLFAGQAAIQFYALLLVNDQWYVASTLGWTLFWGLGNMTRFGILVWRIW